MAFFVFTKLDGFRVYMLKDLEIKKKNIFASQFVNYSFRSLQFKNGTVKIFMLSNFDKHDKAQLLIKFK